MGMADGWRLFRKRHINRDDPPRPRSKASYEGNYTKPQIILHCRKCGEPHLGDECPVNKQNILTHLHNDMDRLNRNMEALIEVWRLNKRGE